AAGALQRGGPGLRGGPAPLAPRRDGLPPHLFRRPRQDLPPPDLARPVRPLAPDALRRRGRRPMRLLQAPALSPDHARAGPARPRRLVAGAPPRDLPGVQGRREDAPVYRPQRAGRAAPPPRARAGQVRLPSGTPRGDGRAPGPRSPALGVAALPLQGRGPEPFPRRRAAVVV